MSRCHIRPPALPIPGPFTVLPQPFLFLGQILILIDENHSWLFVRTLDSEKEKTKRLTDDMNPFRSLRRHALEPFRLRVFVLQVFAMILGSLGAVVQHPL